MKRLTSDWIFILISSVVLALIAFSAVDALTPIGSATSPDSIHYLDIASHIKEGRGVVTTDFSLEFAGQDAVKAERIWPPIYPSLLSKFVADPFDVQAVPVLSKILLFLLGLITLLLLRQARLNYVIALGASILLMVTLPMVLVYAYVWSETLFIPLLLAMVWSGGEYLKTTPSKRWKRVGWLSSSVLLAILLALTRYIGVAMVALLPLLYLLGKRDRWAAGWIALLGVPYLGIVGPQVGSRCSGCRIWGS